MDLHLKGFQVFPPPPDFNPEVSIVDYHSTMDSFPEFTSIGYDSPRVMGGFSALGNPGSFHNPMVKLLRRQVLEHLKPFFRQAAEIHKSVHQIDKVFLVQDFDRMLFRPKGVKPTPEMWHRDVSRYTKSKTTEHFGGWINLGNHPQYFHCIPNSQLGHFQAQNPGFNLVKPSETSAKDFKSQLLKLNFKKHIVPVPPGHILLFNSTILHTVVGSCDDHNQYRLFLSFRFQSTEDASDVQSDAMNKQGIPLLPSGQTPPMFAKLHKSCWRDRLLQFSTFFKDSIPRDKDGFVKRFIPSLTELGLPLYPPYTEEDKAALRPIKL